MNDRNKTIATVQKPMQATLLALVELQRPCPVVKL